MCVLSVRVCVCVIIAGEHKFLYVLITNASKNKINNYFNSLLLLYIYNIIIIIIIISLYFFF